MARQLGAIDTRVMAGAYGGGGGGSSVSIGTYSSLPGSATNAGDIYKCTDSPVEFVWTGAAWQAYWGTYPITLPLSSGWSWDNQGSATLDASLGIQQIAEDVQGNVVNYRVRYRSIPSAPYTVTALIAFAMPPINYRNGGLCLRQSSDGKLITFRLQWNGSWRIAVVKHADSSTDTATYTDITNVGDMLSPYAWMRIQDDSTNLYFHISGDGLNFNYIYSVARTDYLTADGIGFFISARDNTALNPGAAMSLISWVEA